jgi:hypothetical protein
MNPGFKKVPAVDECLAILQLLAQSPKNQLFFKPGARWTKGKKRRVGREAPPRAAVFFLTGAL